MGKEVKLIKQEEKITPCIYGIIHPKILLTQEILEKPITSKVVPVDLLNNVQIENFIFSKEDDNIAVNYKDKSGIERLNIYKADDGSKISSKLDYTFNKDIYSVKAENFDGDKLIISVYKTDGTNDNSTGKYSLNIKSEEMIKL